MIESLRIEQVKIVEQAELEFGPGFNVLTGETGAGKSIILGALELLAGGRGSPDAVRQGAQGGSLEAIFRTEELPDFEAELTERGFDFRGADGDEGHELLVHRTVSRSGRSRARVAGQLVPISTLGELLGGRMEIASQHSSQTLRRPEHHGLLLDKAGGLLELRSRVGERHARLRAIDSEIDALRNQDEERERRRDFLAFQVDEIDAVELSVEDYAALGAEQGRLGHAEQLREDGAALVSYLQGDESAVGAANAVDLIASAARLAEGLANLDPALEPLAERLASAESDLAEIARDFERYADRIEADPSRLARVEERLAQIEKLRRKYGGSIEEILEFRDQAAQELRAIEGAGAREGELRQERDGEAERLTKDAAGLSRGRKKAARELGKKVQTALADLDMENARFEVELQKAAHSPDLPCSSVGAEVAEFKFSANEGVPVQPLQKVASGGELSRVFLAVKSGLRKAGAGMVLVFDEVDAGIGGRAAQRVGRALAELSRHHQVVCITHLPQIAAFADVHFRVEKSEQDGIVRAGVSRLDEQGRLEEVARMAGGEKVTQATLQHARDLLRENSLS